MSELVGGATARDLVLTGRPIDATEALSLGLVVDVVSPEELRDAVLRRAAMIAEAPRDVLVATKAKFIAASSISPETPTLSI